MMNTGFTPIRYIASALPMGIQQLERVILALLARVNVGAAISATTAGRMPLKMLSTRGEGSAKGGAKGSWQLAQFVSDEYAHVDGKDTGTTLCDGDDVEELLLFEPMAAVHYLALDNGNHGVSTPKGECANLEEVAEQMPVDTSCHHLVCCSIQRRALTNASIHGVTSSFWRSAGYQPFCQGKMARSRWGIMARCRPSALQMPATL